MKHAYARGQGILALDRRQQGEAAEAGRHSTATVCSDLLHRELCFCLCTTSTINTTVVAKHVITNYVVGLTWEGRVAP